MNDQHPDLQAVDADDKAYWQDFYAKAVAPIFPSQFAVFVQSWLLGQDINMVEFGCGNGRDSQFFHGQGHSVTVTDQHVSDELQTLAGRSERFNFVEGDVTETSAEVFSTLAQSKPDAQQVIYSRFFQHSIPEAVEKQMLVNIAEHMDPGALLFFEFRLEQDTDIDKIFKAHFRRFPSSDLFVNTVDGFGLKCIYRAEGTGFANYKEEDPYVGRFVFKRADESAQ